MKKFKPQTRIYQRLGLLLAALGLTLLGACFDDRLPRPGELTGGLLVWHSFGNNTGKVIQTSLEEFQQLNPHVALNSEYLPTPELLPRFIEQSQKGLGASTIVDFSRAISELVKIGRIQPIESQKLDLTSYYPRNLHQVSYKDKLYGVPLGSRTKVLCYNKSKLQASPDPIFRQPPTSLEGLIARAQKGYSVGMISSFEDTFWGMGIFGGSLFDEHGRVNPQLEGWAKWLEWLKQAMNQPNFILMRAERTILHDAFAQGQLAYYVCNSEEITSLTNVLKDDLQVAVLPHEAASKAKPILYTMALMINASATPAEASLALALAKFITNPEQQLQGIVQTQSFIPSNQRVLADPTLLPLESVLLEQAKTAVVIPQDDFDTIFPLFEQGEILYQKAITGDISPAAAAQQLGLLVPRSSS